MLIPLVLVLPLAPGLAVPGCAVCAPALPVACGPKAAAVSTGEARYKDEDGLAEVHLSPTFLRCVTLNEVVLEVDELVVDPLAAPIAFPAAGCPSASTS